MISPFSKGHSFFPCWEVWGVGKDKVGHQSWLWQKWVYLTPFKWVSSRNQALEDTQMNKISMADIFAYTAPAFLGTASHS